MRISGFSLRRNLRFGGRGKIIRLRKGTGGWETCFGNQEKEWARGEGQNCGAAPWGYGHQAACCRIYFSSRPARTATAKGGGEQLKTGTQKLGIYYVLGVIFIGPTLCHSYYIYIYLHSYINSVAPEDVTMLRYYVIIDSHQGNHYKSFPVHSLRKKEVNSDTLKKNYDPK